MWSLKCSKCLCPSCGPSLGLTLTIMSVFALAGCSRCIPFPPPLSSTHFHVPLLPLTTMFQRRIWSKGEIKQALFIDGAQNSENGSYGISFLSPHRKSIWLHLFPSTGLYTQQTAQVILGASRRGCCSNITNVSLWFPRQWAVEQEGVPSAISLRSFKWSVTYTCGKQIPCY